MGRKPQWIEEIEAERVRLLHRLRQVSDDVHPYTVLHPHGMNGHDLITSGKDFAPLPAAEAMEHVPGSWERIEEMRRRVGRCEELWHKDDCDSFDGVAEKPKPSDVRDTRNTLSRVEELMQRDPGLTFNPRSRQIIEDKDRRS